VISPKDLGLPPKFAHWRLGQEQVITNMAYPKRRYSVHVVPMGGGKSVCYMAAATLNRGRTLILTSTKGLQDQLGQDFKGKVAIVKGQSAYKCKLSGNQYWCNTGSCHWGYECPHRIAGDCYYRQAIAEANRSRIVVTNYSFWMANVPEVLGPFELLVMDEAHDAVEHLMGTLSIEIRKDEVTGMLDWPEPGSQQGRYYEWAKVLKGIVDDRVKKGKRESRGKYKVLALQQKLQLMDKVWISNWVVEHKGKSIAWDVIWPASLAQSYLFRGVNKVILTSATVTEADAYMLGLKPGEVEYTEYPSTFPVANRRVYIVPTVRMDRFITDAGMNAWATKIDNIIRTRFGYKGIIHTASYDRAARICNFSHYKDFMVSHKGHNTIEVVNRFKQADPPNILVSPSVSTGYDFPDDDARWQIIGKVPFPDSRPLVMKARQKVNPDYGCHIAIKQLIQASGRLVRSGSDWGDTFILDNHIVWVMSRYRKMFPKWWLESVLTVNVVPQSR
jgi:Rad3-related DNA helicase